jgi:hypothetical protein
VGWNNTVLVRVIFISYVRLDIDMWGHSAQKFNVIYDSKRDL